MHQGILATQARDAQSDVLDRRHRRLPMHQVAVHERVLQQWHGGIDVVLAHLANVLEHERHRFQDAVLHVQVGDAVLVHQRRKDGERTARLRHDGNGHGGANAHLALLHLQVAEQGVQDILRPDGLGNVSKRVHRGSANRLLVRLEHLQQLEAYSHPLAGAHVLSAAIGDPSHQVDAVLLHLLVAVPQNRRQPREQFADRRRHLVHTDHVHDALQGAQDRAQHVRILFAQVLEENLAEVPEPLLLSTPLDARSDPRDEVRGLHAHSGRGVVQAPLDGAADLRQVRLRPRAQGVHDRPEATEHDRRVLARLLLVGVQDAVHQLLFHLLGDVRGPQVLDDVVYGLHDHLPVRLGLVLQVLDDPRDDVRGVDLVRDFRGHLDDLPVVAPVQRHAAHPKVAQELRQDVLPNVVRLHAVGAHTLLDHLEHDLLHLLVGALKLSNQDDHHVARVEVGVVGVHQWDDEPNGLQEGRQALATVRPDALPERHQHAVEGLDPVGVRGLRQGRDGERGDGAHLLLVVHEAVLDDVHHLLQVRQDGAAHEDRDLLDDLDAGVARLPALPALAHGLEERQQRRHPERGGDDSESSRGGVSNVLVHVVDVRPHGRDHRGEARGLAEVRDDLAPLDASVVLLVDQQRLDDHEDLMYIRPHQVPELVEDAIDDLDHEVPFLVLQGRRHQDGKDLLEQRPRAQILGLVGDDAHGRLALWRSAVLDLQQEPHDLALVLRHLVQVLLVRPVRQLPEVLHVLGLDRGQIPRRAVSKDARQGHAVGLGRRRRPHREAGAGERRGSAKEAGRRRHVRRRHHAVSAVNVGRLHPQNGRSRRRRRAHVPRQRRRGHAIHRRGGRRRLVPPRPLPPRSFRRGRCSRSRHGRGVPLAAGARLAHLRRRIVPLGSRRGGGAGRALPAGPGAVRGRRGGRPVRRRGHGRRADGRRRTPRVIPASPAAPALVLGLSLASRGQTGLSLGFLLLCQVLRLARGQQIRRFGLSGRVLRRHDVAEAPCGRLV
eukprot:scaffold4871_cov260-Pinguiococcus_pyrenoidosus.AAC.6